ncbi:MAG: CHASE domain-containing protein [Sneathiella sp.]|nr:CHASE domain-containing protein [Sneathiella sp.]
MTAAPSEITHVIDKRRLLVQRGSLHWVHWSVVLLSVVLTLGAWYISSEQVAQKNQIEFRRQADQVANLVEERMHLYENALWGGVAFIDANDGQTSYEQWFAYSNSLNIDEVYPGINGIGVIHNIKPADVADYLFELRKVRPDYEIHPKHDEKELWPITYIEPSTPNAKAIGLDMAFESNRYTSIKKARDQGSAQVTGPITLVQDAKKTPGFLFYAPFYKAGSKPATIEDRRKNIVGVTYAPFIMNKLMLGTLASENRQVRIKISDGGTLLYDDEDNDVSGQDANPLFTHQANIGMYGRNWEFDIQSSLGFRQASSNSQPYWILVGGLIIDSLLLGLFIMLTQANRTALRFADEMTIALKEESNRLKKSNDDLEQFSYVASHDLKAPLNSIKQVIGWIEEDCGHLIPEESKKHIQMLKNRSQRMMQLLKDLLDYSQVNRFEYSIETVSLQQMTSDIIFLLGAEKKLNCIVPNVDLLIPRTPLEIVLRNLFSNTLKHHHSDNSEIKIRYTSRNGGHELSIEDDGPGIPDHLHDKAIEMFQTLKPRDQVEGSGMGLAMVKKIIEFHGGTFKIETGRKSGTCFLIFWPFDEVNPAI